MAAFTHWLSESRSYAVDIARGGDEIYVNVVEGRADGFDREFFDRLRKSDYRVVGVNTVAEVATIERTSSGGLGGSGGFL